MRISVFQSKELQGVIVALSGFDKELLTQIRKHTRTIGQAEWQAALEKRATTPLEKKVLVSTARVAVSNQNVTLKSATIGRSLSGGGKPSELVGAAGFGADRSKQRDVITHSRKGKRYIAKDRHTQSQFKDRKKTGYVVYPAAAEVIPRIAALWVQTTVRALYDTIEKS